MCSSSVSRLVSEGSVLFLEFRLLMSSFVGGDGRDSMSDGGPSRALNLFLALLPA